MSNSNLPSAAAPTTVNPPSLSVPTVSNSSSGSSSPSPRRSSSSSSFSPGHVFLLHTDLRYLSCDVFAIPTGPKLIPGRNWRRPETQKYFEALEAAKETEQIRGVPNWPAEFPYPFLLNTHTFRASVDGLENITQCFVLFLEHALKYCRTLPGPRNRRAKFLIGMPLLGSGGAGAGVVSGQLIHEIFPVLLGFARSNSVDIAFCTNERDKVAAMRSDRMRYFGSVFDDLGPELRAEGERLAKLATQGKLVLFLGAGCSVGAGLPSWGSLLQDLARGAGMSDQDIGDMAKLNFLDQARLIGKRIGGVDKLAQAIASKLQSPVFSLVHALLAGLRCAEQITTNYDTLFERACESVHGKISVLPYVKHGDGSEWLLKLHGCVTHPEDIVLTREDYIRYEARRSALSGVVQSLLLTKHLLFVGFSLSDDNFLKMLDAVKRAAPRSTGEQNSHFGTALFLIKERFIDELFSDEVRVVPVSEVKGAPTGADWGAGARRLEIFLDYVSSCASKLTCYFLDFRFEGALTAPDIKFRDELLNFFAKGISEEARKSDYVQKVMALVWSEFGINNPMSFAGPALHNGVPVIETFAQKLQGDNNNNNNNNSNNSGKTPPAPRKN